jgi:hypothetical protein
MTRGVELVALRVQRMIVGVFQSAGDTGLIALEGRCRRRGSCGFRLAMMLGSRLIHGADQPWRIGQSGYCEGGKHHRCELDEDSHAHVLFGPAMT